MAAATKRKKQEKEKIVDPVRKVMSWPIADARQRFGEVLKRVDDKWRVLLIRHGTQAASANIGRELIERIAASNSEVLDLLTQVDSAAFRRKANVIVAPIVQLDETGELKIRFRLDDAIYLSPRLARQIVWLEELINDTIYEHAFAAGEGYLIDNHRILHGRRGFLGQREVWRVLINGNIQHD